MAKKQTRRSVSLSKAKYEILKAHSEKTGKSMSQCVEQWIGEGAAALRQSEQIHALGRLGE